MSKDVAMWRGPYRTVPWTHHRRGVYGGPSSHDRGAETAPQPVMPMEGPRNLEGRRRFSEEKTTPPGLLSTRTRPNPHDTTVLYPGPNNPSTIHPFFCHVSDRTELAKMSTADELKALGNKAIAAKNFDEAV